MDVVCNTLPCKLLSVSRPDGKLASVLWVFLICRVSKATRAGNCRSWAWISGLLFRIKVCKFVNLLICGGSVSVLPLLASAFTRGPEITMLSNKNSRIVLSCCKRMKKSPQCRHNKIQLRKFLDFSTIKNYVLKSLIYSRYLYKGHTVCSSICCSQFTFYKPFLLKAHWSRKNGYPNFIMKLCY